MLEFTPVHPQLQVNEQQNEEELSRCLDEEFAQYGISLRTAFAHIHAGRLMDASRPLLEISKWLVTNVEGLGRFHCTRSRLMAYFVIIGILRADRADLLPLWNDLNTCWLALFQKQLDMKHDLVAARYMPTMHNLLTSDRMEAMGNELIQLCDQLEPHGLVDYQIGILEEEILSGRCFLSFP
jgi:hypothetical protein